MIHSVAAFSQLLQLVSRHDFNRIEKGFKLGHFFVTRMKRGVRYTEVELHEVDRSKGLTSDQVILLTGSKAKECPIPLRRIGYRDPETGKHYVFHTNIRLLVAKTICDIYHDRWQIELFFKCIKQDLKTKTFFDTSRNAVLTQLWVAIIALLMLAFFKFKAKLGQKSYPDS